MEDKMLLIVAFGAVFAVLMVKAIASIIWPDNRFVRFFGDMEARGDMDRARCRGTTGGDGGLFDHDGGDGGGGGD